MWEPSALADPGTWLALLSLVAMEVVLGIDNIVFITILTSRLPQAVRDRTARVGIGLALVMRVGLLFTISWIMSLTRELATVLGVSITGKSLILLVGGVFLIGKATLELHKKIDEEDDTPVGTSGDAKARVGIVLAQIVLLDLIFSLDSVITAVGMVPPDQIWVMVVAIVVSVAVMLAGAKPIAGFVTRHPTMKVLALAFLILIGVMLLAEGIGQTIPKGYIYFAMAFSIVVELVNIKIRGARSEPKELPETS